MQGIFIAFEQQLSLDTTTMSMFIKYAEWVMDFLKLGGDEHMCCSKLIFSDTATINSSICFMESA